ncbi:MAG TPA: ThiF family adenylyltransferase [Clostridia bacterium]|nr:ThiF family adenylyltransferase [Clostridia bacterium]
MVDKLLASIKDKKIAIIGAGGLGGNLINYIARLNPKAILIFDGDVFCQSNMNRQLFCTDKTLNLNKAQCAKDAVINYTTAEVTAISQHLTWENSFILKDFDVIMDATDNIEARRLMERACNEYKIPVIHGAICGLFGQVAVIKPETSFFSQLNASGKTLPSVATLSYVPSLISSIQVSEMLKLMAGLSTLENGEMMVIDLLNNDIRIIKL